MGVWLGLPWLVVGDLAESQRIAMGSHTVVGLDSVWHHEGYVLGCMLSKLGSVSLCVVVIHEVGCDVSTNIGTEYDAGGYVGCARWSQSDVGRWVTAKDFAFGSGIVVRRGCRDRVPDVGSYWMCGHDLF